ncbi:helix-turn-helix domain-containing protein [Brevibacillus migulae]|uniref:helix-turn-helix domain-containing protein n=1 Tax=Brevibacillus migulae TaxID=1644114 RepID=UPI00106E3789|nr:helix-turn-helix domain-containing protein [Brevibacillus migulae]
MQGGVNVLLYTTIGDIIRKYRERANLSITQLANLSGLSKGAVSKIERGDTKRPEMHTIKAIKNVLDIPYQEIVEHYITVEERVDVLLDLLLEAIQFSDAALASKVAAKFLVSSREDTYSLLERLYDFTTNVENTQFQLLLYNTITKYARDRGIPQYIARGLLQRYLIERDDFSKLSQTYQNGKEIVNYAHFLPVDERILMYYKLGVHAYNLRLFEDCINLCKNVVEEDLTESKLKVDATIAIYNCYYYLGDYESTEYYLNICSRYSLPHVQEEVKLMQAVLTGKKGDLDTAIDQLEHFVESAGDNTILHVANLLLELYLQRDRLAEIEVLLRHEERIKKVPLRTPYKKTEMARFIKQKGDYYLRKGQYDDAINFYLHSALEYGKVNEHEKGYETINHIVSHFIKNDENMNLEVLKKLQKVYNILSKEK